MMYMPATTAATPVVFQQTQQQQQYPLQASSRYYMLQSAPIVPAVPVLNTTYVYPRYGFVPKPVETSFHKDDIERSQAAQILEIGQPVQHIVHHHHAQPCSTATCAGYCELCAPWHEHSTHQHSRSRSSSPRSQDRHQQRYSRRDEFERDEFDHTHPSKHETIDEKIERIRRELRQSSCHKHDQSTETSHHYQPRPRSVDHHDHHHETDHHVHCETDHHRSKSRSHSRPRSASSHRHRSSSLPRDPWRSSNQNDYPWRDSHLPAYREVTLARSQTPVNESHTWHETAHDRSHQNTQHNSASYYNKKDYIYRPKSETEARKYYTQTTGKDPDREVHQALRGGTTTYKYNGSGTHYDKHQSSNYEKHCGSNYEHGFYSDIPTTSKTHTLHKIDATQHHNLYGCNEPCLHIVPKHGSTLDPPYMKIMNAPVTYLH